MIIPVPCDQVDRNEEERGRKVLDDKADNEECGRVRVEDEIRGRSSVGVEVEYVRESGGRLPLALVSSEDRGRGA